MKRKRKPDAQDWGWSAELHGVLAPLMEDYHRAKAIRPDEWFECAERLWDAAELIWPMVRGGWVREIDGFKRGDGKARTEGAALTKRYTRSAMLLSGYAVENILKAIVVKRGLLREGMRHDPKRTVPFDDPFYRHDLTELAALIRVPLRKTDANLLERLQQFVRWSGRYPTPIHLDEAKSRVAESSDDPEKVADLFKRFCDAYSAGSP